MIYKVSILNALLVIFILALLSGCSNTTKYLTSRDFWLGGETASSGLDDMDTDVPYPYSGYYYMEHDDSFGPDPSPIEQNEWRRYSDQAKKVNRDF